MIELPENISIDMRELSHARDLLDLWKTDTDAFIYGLYNPRVMTYINNINLKKKNPSLYYDITNLKKESLQYKDDMQKLIDEYIQDGSESPIGMVNYVLKNIKYVEEEDKYKVAYALGNYVRFNLVTP